MAFRSDSPMIVALPPFRGVTRTLVLTAAAVFFALLLIGLFSHELEGTLVGIFALLPETAFHTLIWQLVTYPFVSLGILSFPFAALSVWFFGAALEGELGPRWLTEFFLACTLGGALLAGLFTFTVGRSIEGLGPANNAFGMWPFSLALLLAFARLHPQQELNFSFILRVKAKYLAILLLLFYLAVMLASRERFDALVVLTNCLGGWLFLRFAPRRGLRFAASEGMFGLRNAWYRARRRRAAKKFTVYMQKQGRDVHFDERGRYVDPDAKGRDPNDRKWMN